MVTVKCTFICVFDGLYERSSHACLHNIEMSDKAVNSQTLEINYILHDLHVPCAENIISLNIENLIMTTLYT